MKQEPGSPQQRAVKQEPQDIGQFLLPEHGHVLECLGTYIDPQCFPGADFELDLSVLDGDDSITQAEVEELFAQEISSESPAQQNSGHNSLAPFSSSSSCPSPGNMEAPVLAQQPLLQLLLSDASTAAPLGVLPAGADFAADPSTPTSLLQHTPVALASSLHNSSGPNPSLTPASLAWQAAAPFAAGSTQQQVPAELMTPTNPLLVKLAARLQAVAASSGRAHTAGSGLNVPAPVKISRGAASNQMWTAAPATPAAAWAGGVSTLACPHPNLVQQLLTQQLTAAQGSFLQMPPVTPAAPRATQAPATTPAPTSFRRSSITGDSPNPGLSWGNRRRSSSSDASQPASSLGPLSRPMKRARTSNRGTASVKPVQGAASVPAAAWLAVSTKVAPPAIRMGRSPAAFAWGAPGVNSSVHAFDQSLPFCAVPGSSQPSTRKGVFRNTATGCWEARYRANSAGSVPGVLLGAFDSEAEAAHAYDLVVLTVEGPRAAVTNYDASECGGAGLGQLLAAGMHAVLRCISNYQQTMACFVPILPGVFPSMALEGHWEARLYQGKDYKYLGAFSNTYAAASAAQAAEQALRNPKRG